MLCARSRDILGPYITESGYRLLDCRYDTIFSGNDICAGPGHNARFVDDDNGNTWIIYHGYRRGSADKGRVLWIDRVRWEGGWPRLGDNGHPSSGGEAPYFIRNNHITSNR
jgi:beta-xylosidase